MDNPKLDKQIEQEEKRDGRDEMNLAEYPFAVLSKRVSADQKTIEVNLPARRNREGKLIPRSWIVTGSDKYGLPRVDDEKLYIALMEVTRENGFSNRHQKVIRHQLLKKLGWHTTSYYYQKLIESLNRIKSVNIFTTNLFWDNESKSYIPQTAFSIVDDYEFKPPFLEWSWNRVVWRSILANNIKKLDVKLWLSWKSDITRRLHRYLDKHFYHSPVYVVEDLRTFAQNHLGVSKRYNLAQTKRLIERSAQEMKEADYLKDYTFTRESWRQYSVVFYKADQLLLPFPEEPEEAEADLADWQLQCVEELKSRGLDEEIAVKFVQSYEEAYLRKHIRDFDARIEGGESPKNPPGFLRKKIEKDWLHTEFQAREQEVQKRAERERKKREFDQRFPVGSTFTIRGKRAVREGEDTIYFPETNRAAPIDHYLNSLDQIQLIND
jgi:hypothetical protein